MNIQFESQELKVRLCDLVKVRMYEYILARTPQASSISVLNFEMYVVLH